jgi:hypothetical protein
MRAFFLVIVVLGTVSASVLLVSIGALQTASAQYRLSINPAAYTPLNELTGLVVPINPAFTFSMYHFTNRTPLSVGGSIGFQYYNQQPERRGRDHSYELLTFPLLMGFHVNLLPDFVVNHYYGAEMGIMFMRYTLHTPQLTTSIQNIIGLTVAPNTGFRIQIAENLLLDLNVRYQLTFHREVIYGPTEQYRTSGFNALGWTIGFSYAVNGGRN